MTMQSVAVLGAGAVGSYIIWGMSQALGDNFCVVANGERKQKLEQEGLFINHKKYELNVKTPKEAHGVDLLIVTTKYGALSGILDDVSEIVADHTIVMSLLNGVDSEEIIASRIGEEHLLYSLIKISSNRDGQSIVFDEKTTRGILFGEKGLDKPSQRMKDVARLFDKTPIRYQMSSAILQEIWYKFAFNVSWNLPQAIVNCGTGAFAVSDHMKMLRTCLRQEVERVAAAKGIDISELSDIEKTDYPSTPVSRYSTLQDLDAGRHTEIEMFSGTICRYGKELGIPTPYNTFTYHTIRALEEKNDGKFLFS